MPAFSVIKKPVLPEFSANSNLKVVLAEDAVVKAFKTCAPVTLSAVMEVLLLATMTSDRSIEMVSTPSDT
jgi:hypothetical protein